MIPANEQQIYDELVLVRQKLSSIKKDHSKFIDSREITSIYQDVLSKARHLKETRGPSRSPELVLDDPNQVDVLMDDIFQLLSLCFVTCGLTNTAPATYASLSTVQRLLEHLNESSIYTPHDLKPIKERLDDISHIIDSNQEDNDNLEINLLKSKLKFCYDELNYMINKTANVSPRVQSIIDSLISIKYELFNLITNNDDSSQDQISNLSAKLNEIKEQTETLLTESPNFNGEGIVKGLTDNCTNYLKDLQMGIDRVDTELRPTYENLLQIRSTLQKLLVTRRWTLRTTDIFSYLKRLNDIDNSRVNGYFISKNLKGQSVLLYLLRSSFAIIYKLLESCEPVSESLGPIHNQLSTIRRCLLDLKRYGGISSMRELYPYQLKLDSIDNMKSDGKFIIKNQIPEGQGAVVALLAECFDICHELKLEFELKREQELQNGGDDKKEESFVVGTKAGNYDYNASDE